MQIDSRAIAPTSLLMDGGVLRIDPVGLHWLVGTREDADLCAHSGLRLMLGGEVVLDASDEQLTASTTALHLLRTLTIDHTSEHPIAEHLAPCCGHFMVIDEVTHSLVNVGCPNGRNWWVRHEGGAVELLFEGGRSLQVTEDAWCRAVVRFSDAVEAFYAASAPKAPKDAFEEEWFTLFRAEWAARRASCGSAAGHEEVDPVA